MGGQEPLKRDRVLARLEEAPGGPGRGNCFMSCMIHPRISWTRTEEQPKLAVDSRETNCREKGFSPSNDLEGIIVWFLW